MTKVLFASSEVHPLIKTGGLADVSASLPRALLKQGCDIRVVMPAYAQALDTARPNGLKKIAQLSVAQDEIILWQTRLPGTRLTLWLVDHSLFSERPGNPYCASEGEDWSDNHLRFMLFNRALVEISQNRAGLKWQPDVVHCNDWQTGMVPYLLSQEKQRPATVFTIHNLMFRGLFRWDQFAELGLPHEDWHHERLEFYDQLSFMKAALVYADRITTVSPTYAQEIQTPAQGWGLDGLLLHRQAELTGILNGINSDEWNPGKDPYIPHTYNRRSLNRKLQNKSALQESSGLDVIPDKPVLGFIGRLVEQKGMDLLLAVLPALLAQGKIQCVMLGTGMPHYQKALHSLAQAYPTHFSLTIGYSEELAHCIEAGADLFLMPSLFEPCGLNQLYSLRYGTPPVVHAVGGLKDTVKDAKEHGDKATGFSFYGGQAHQFAEAIERALEAYQQPEVWKTFQSNAMSEDYSWDESARKYLALYDSLQEDKA